MTSSAITNHSVSHALIPYTPPSLRRSDLEERVGQAFGQKRSDQAFAHSLEVAKFEVSHLSTSTLPPFARSPARLAILAEHLPKILADDRTLPLPFSGVVAFQVGDAEIVQASHCPNQVVEFTTDQSLNVLSVGKLFTAVAVMQMIEEGRFSLDTPLSKLLSPEELDLPLRSPYEGENPSPKILRSLKKQMHRITLKQILSHTAGLIGGDGIPGKVGSYTYSNYGYRLLAQIIGKHAGYRDSSLSYEAGFKRYIETRIFRPAKMFGAVAEISLAKKKGSEPDCFEIVEDGFREKVTIDEPYPHGNGGWRMPARDLLKFAEAIRHGTLITNKSLRTMLFQNERSLGFMLDRDEQTKLPKLPLGFGHPGHGPGRSAFLWSYFSGLRITAVVLSNYNTGDVKPLLDPIFQPSKDRDQAF